MTSIVSLSDKKWKNVLQMCFCSQSRLLPTDDLKWVFVFCFFSAKIRQVASLFLTRTVEWMCQWLKWCWANENSSQSGEFKSYLDTIAPGSYRMLLYFNLFLELSGSTWRRRTFLLCLTQTFAANSICKIPCLSKYQMDLIFQYHQRRKYLSEDSNPGLQVEKRERYL